MGFKELYNDVIKESLFHKSRCTVCGACVLVCPQNLLEFREELFYSPKNKDKEALIDKKTLEDIFTKCSNCGLCYDACPEINFNLEDVERKMFGTISNKYTAMGYIKDIFSAQSRDNRLLLNGQAGGVVTSLVRYLITEEIVDGMIVTVGSEENNWKPIPVTITKENMDQLLTKSQKSRYLQSATLANLRKVIMETNLRKIGIVLLPCQAHALAKMKMNSQYQWVTNKIKVTIGLFCLGTYWSGKFFDILKKKYSVTPDKIVKMQFLQDFFVFELKDGSIISGNRNVFMSALKESCKHCKDFTNIMSDISVGEIGSPKNWSTVIVRTDVGSKIISDAIKKGYIATSPLQKEGLEKLYEIALLKFKYYVTKKTLRLTKNSKLETIIKTLKTLKLPTASELGVFSIHISTNAGLPVYARNFIGSRPNVDESIIAGITTAVNEYVKTIFRDEYIKEIDVESARILVEHGPNIRIVCVISRDSKSARIRKIMKKILTELEQLDVVKHIENNNLIDENIEDKIEDVIKRHFLSF